MRDPRPYLALVCLTLVALAACGEQTRTATPQFSADPGAFLFPKLTVGQDVVRTVDLINLGSGTLNISEVALQDDSSADELSLFSNIDGELVPVAGQIRLGQDERHSLVIRYRPSDEAIDEGRVTLRTNDPDAIDVTIPITIGAQAGEISVTPRTLDFGRVSVDESAERQFTISNIGLADLVISRLSVEGRADFTAQIGDAEVLGDELDTPVTIQPDETIEVTVRFSPRGALRADSELLIASNAINAPSLSVSLIANGALPCLQVNPESLDFGAGLTVESRDIQTPNILPLTLESCGTSSLRIERIEFVSASNGFGAIDLPMAEPGTPLFELPAATPDEAPPSEQVTVGFWPTEIESYGGQIFVHSNDPQSPHVIDLFGRGVDNQCPVPVSATAVYEVQPLDIITLDGTPSTDPGGSVVEWQWTVVNRPDGSVSQPVETFTDARRPADGGDPDDTTTSTAQFFVDLAGAYTLELRVVDNLGQTSCEPNPVATVTIEAIPDKDLHIQLVWATPNDPDESDQFGTDVDLHFRHQNAGDGWASAANDYDVYFRNKQPDWGVEGDVADNPSLDIDDTNGAGPENINLASPEIGVSYDVAAIYFRNESTFGDAMNDPRVQHPSYVTVRIFARGELLNEFVGREMTEPRQLWHIATIEWCEDAEDLLRCPDITVRDQLISEGDYRSQ